jgi:biotin carboxyl carrier protein
LPPAVARTLDAYLAESKCSLLIALPLADSRLEGPNKTSSVLLAESFSPALSAVQLRERLDCVARHVGPALGNAIAMDRLPLKWITRPLASLQAGLGASSKLRLFAFVAVLVACTAFLAFFPLPLKPEATGQLVPIERRIIYATLNGTVVQLAVEHGDRVEKGQELLFIEDLDTQLKVDQLSVKISSMIQKLNHLEDQLNKPLSAKERADYLNDRIGTQYELGKAKVERNLLLGENRTPRKAPMAAPMPGQIVTFDAKEKLLGKTVKIGDPLLRLAAVTGPWEVELFIPERDAGLLREALVREPSGELVVDLLVTNDPHRVYSGKIRRGALGGETVTQNDKVVLPAHVTIEDRALLQQLEQMPVGVEVRARIHCGHAPAGYVWFNEIWTFLYEKFLF